MAPAGGRRVPSLLIFLACIVTALPTATIGCSSRNESGDETEWSPAAMESDVAYLASDELLGRLVGEPGIASAEEYIAASFEASGLETFAGDDDYFDEFTVERTWYDERQTFLEISDTVVARGGESIAPLRYSSPAAVSGELVFAGYGITAPSVGHYDYSDLDVRDRLVLVLRGEPETQDPSSPFYGPNGSKYGYWIAKANEARRHGAAGIIIANGPTTPESPAEFMFAPQFLIDTPGYRVPPEASSRIADGYPVVLASRSVLESAAGEWGISAAELADLMDSGESPASLSLAPLPSVLRLPAVNQEPHVPARNVVGVIRGSSDEWVIVGAHHDHLGGRAGPADTIFNGADDNASGVSIVLELARRFSGTSPKRGIIFVTFSGEEQGFLGSTVFATGGRVHPKDVALMVNVDMAARNTGQPVTVHYSRDIPLRLSDLQAFADSEGLPITLVDQPLGRDDSYPFMLSGIPVIFPFSGFHEDYHKVDDEADRLDYDRLGLVAGFVYSIVRTVAFE